MRAKDVMTASVVTVGTDTSVREIAGILAERRISAVPVVSTDGKVAGIVSEGDLIRRAETQTERRPSWWLTLLSDPADKALDYIKAHGGTAKDVMTRKIISVGEDATLEEIADTLERNHIKRVLVMTDGKLVGIVSRADLLRGLASRKPASEQVAKDDEALRKNVEEALKQTGATRTFVTVIASDGVVHLWGAVDTQQEDAIRVAAENTAGVKNVDNGLSVLPPMVRAAMWAD
ncbi:CBS domain-containing protein [Roseibium salinum]|uniref:CBS domain-containing protein n=1 Tax=Roseibium salinum TaxID=1604349 RepID=UPI00360B46B2